MSELRKYYFEDLEKLSDKWESSFGVYDEYIPPSLHNILSSGRKKITFVEVGVQRGGSLEMWSKFFADEQIAYRDILQEFFEIEIIGIDIDPECLKLKYNSSNVKVIIVDEGKPEFWDSFLKEHPQIDIFMDDGGHFMDQQVLTFEKISPALSIGGVYFCEDCHTSYMPYNGGGYKGNASFIEYAKSYVHIIHRDWFSYNDEELNRRNIIGKDLTSIHFFDSIVAFQKFGKKEMKRVSPNAFTLDN